MIVELPTVIANAHRGAVAALVAADEQPVLTAHRESPSKAVKRMAGVR